MDDLARLGFLRKAIMETVVSTYNDDGSPNAAPMGIVTQNMRQMIIRPYVSSLTYKNLKKRRSAVINLTSDPEIFYRTAFKESNPGGKMPSEWFEAGRVVDAPRLRLTNVFIEVSVINIESSDLAERAEMLCDVRDVSMPSLPVKPYCRAVFAAIESIIHATRVKMFLADGRIEEAQRLMKLIDHYDALIRRVAPQSPYSQLMKDLLQRIESWRAVR